MKLEDLNIFCKYQIDWINQPARVAIYAKSRRIGVTYATAFIAVADRVGPSPAKRSDLWFSSADQTAAVEFIDDCATFARMFNEAVQVASGQEIDGDTQISTMSVKFGNGTKITAGSSNPKFFRSKGGDVVLDEFAFHRDGRELFKAAHATSIPWGHTMRIVSTHNGPGSYFNTLLAAAKAGAFKAATHQTTIDDAVADGLHERIRMRADRLDHVPPPDAAKRQAWLDELRSTCPDQDTWNEEYLCVPSTDSSSLLSYELIRGCEVANLQLHDVTTPFAAGGPLYAGFDVGRKKDLSVLWVIEKVGDVFWTRILRVFDRVNFTAQEGAINELLRNHGVKRLCIDSTGIGLQLSERLQQRWGKYRVEAVNFSAPVKSELAMPLRRLFEDKLIRVPMTDAIREDLHSVRKIVTAAGAVRFDVDRSDTDGHADRFWSLALAYHAADNQNNPVRAPLARKPAGW